MRKATSSALVAIWLGISAVRAASNPFAPLSLGEMEHAVALLKSSGNLPEKAIIASLQLQEPAKGAGENAPRVAKATIIDHGARRSSNVFIDLGVSKVREVRLIMNGQPFVTTSEITAATEYVKQSPEWQEAVRRRGITNFSDVSIDVWAGGLEQLRGLSAHRYGHAVSYNRGKQTNNYGPPIEGLEVIVDLDDQKVLRVIDTGVRAVPRESTDFYDADIRGKGQPALKPLLISQPEGPSFEAKDYQVSWDRWRFAWSFNAREGLVLHNVCFVDGDRERPILHRASISEMLIPYGSPKETWFWRNAVDEGEYGLGNSAYPLIPGQTAPSHATLFDIPTCGEDGTVTTGTNRVGLYERANEGLWSHTTWDGDTIGRRSRELVIFFIATVGNYDYRFSWAFRQDGEIEFETGLTGVLQMSGADLQNCAVCRPGGVKTGAQKLSGEERFGTLVARNTIAVNHQHFINVRLDFDIDGPGNSVKEINTVPARGRRDNPYKNAWEAVATVFGKEKDATRDLSAATHRHWAVFNPNVQTALGHYPSYLIEPAGNAVPLMAENTPSRRLLGFINHPFHATRYHEGEYYAGGEYPNQINRPNNVETWSKRNDPINNEDVVVWYTLGMTHAPRPEEYPVMPVSHARFRLVPKGFFTRNPALNVPEGQ
ncbi:MAG TPA: hypothetical protein VHH73_19060 [Verrucomicrobiae bacterium]|nr:hypothetical protein [Verrucomicrobiae bacterium]